MMAVPTDSRSSQDAPAAASPSPGNAGAHHDTENPAPCPDAAAASTLRRAFEAPPTPARYLQMQWAFAYGSLIWNPEFDFDERHKVRIDGYHRAFCINSHTYRGTPDAPGVVLGLDQGGSCEGIVYRVRSGQEAQIMDRIYQREMVSEVYEPLVLSIPLPDGRLVSALTFIACRHDLHGYLPGPHSEVLRRLHQCTGCRGSNRDYALNTQAALHEWGIHDPALDTLIAELQTLSTHPDPDN